MSSRLLYSLYVLEQVAVGLIVVWVAHRLIHGIDWLCVQLWRVMG